MKAKALQTTFTMLIFCRFMTFRCTVFKLPSKKVQHIKKMAFSRDKKSLTKYNNFARLNQIFFLDGHLCLFSRRFYNFSAVIYASSAFNARSACFSPRSCFERIFSPNGGKIPKLTFIGWKFLGDASVI